MSEIWGKARLFAYSRRALLLLSCAFAPFLSGCSKSRSATAHLGPQEVLVTEATQRDVPVVREWIGSLDGSVNADIRARVSGYLVSQNYKEGTLVHQGDLLFQIESSIYEAAVEQAKSAVAQSEANQLQTEQTEKRETQLFEEKVESAQNRDNAVQANVAAKAEVKAQQAALRQAELNLQFTKITAPVSGIAGIANPGIGDLVGPTDAQPLMTMSAVDPIKAYLKISEQDYLKLAKRVEQLRSTGGFAPPAEIFLADGSLYPHQGKFSAVDREVDQQTGTIRLAALFPNPDNVLRPGGFVRVRVTVRQIRGAMLVPQRAVNQLQTSYEVAVVGEGDKVEIRSVKVGDTVDALWVIEEGIKPGERVIVEGTQKVRAGQEVKPMPWTPSGPIRAQ
ncbi:MAG: efflux RND transporter periplasmic adaptor subunit [Verrucomicrobia bacterium]|nr:efflux RND transporter periplasmic adaptor subunit [Verrucomicrobiota bacterium]